MKLNLTKNLVCIDVETSGLSVSKDRVIQIAMIKIFADGSPRVEKVRMINPEVPIHPDATKIHGITNEMVKNEPTFKQLAKGIFDFIGDSDFLTYNGNRFDIPMLMEEFSRVGLELDMTNRKCCDGLRIAHMMEPRHLSAMMEFYTGKKMVNAHDALNDVRATIEIFEAQIEKYEKSGKDYDDGKGTIIKSPIKNNMQAVYDFIVDKNTIDFQGKIKFDEAQNECVFTFGKYQEKPVGESLAADPGYMRWIMNGDFTADTKNHIQRLVNEYLERKNVEANA